MTAPTAAVLMGVKSVQVSSMDWSIGGIVKRIVSHIIRLHFMDDGKNMSKNSTLVAFELRNKISIIDGCASSSPMSFPFLDFLALHKNVFTTFDSFADFLCQNTKMTIDNSLGSKGKKVSNFVPASCNRQSGVTVAVLRYLALPPPPCPCWVEVAATCLDKKAHIVRLEY